MVTEDTIKHYLDYLVITFACTADQETWLFLGLSPIDAGLGRTYAVPFSATETGWHPINASNRLSIAGWVNGTRIRYALQVGLCFGQANHVSPNMIRSGARGFTRQTIPAHRPYNWSASLLTN